jgi:hypothetical protein
VLLDECVYWVAFNVDVSERDREPVMGELKAQQDRIHWGTSTFINVQ